MYFHAPEWLYAVRAHFCFYGTVSGQPGLKPGPGAAPRRLRSGNSFTKHRNEGKHGYHQSSGFLLVLYNGFFYRSA